jgi:hypothetical protein
MSSHVASATQRRTKTGDRFLYAAMRHSGPRLLALLARSEPAYEFDPEH